MHNDKKTFGNQINEQLPRRSFFKQSLFTGVGVAMVGSGLLDVLPASAHAVSPIQNIVVQPGDAQIVTDTGMGKVWHTIRQANGSWQPAFGDVSAQESLASVPGNFGDVSCANIGQVLNICAVSHGKLYHTLRLANGSWQPAYGNVNTVESNNPGLFKRVSCARVGTDLHVCALTQDGKLWHTIRHNDGSWQTYFGDVIAQEMNALAVGRFVDVGCAGVGTDLHVTAVAQNGTIWHTIRHASGAWQPNFGNVNMQESNGNVLFTAVDCAGFADGSLQVCGVISTGDLYHTIRMNNQRWQPAFGSVNGVEMSVPGPFRDVGCSNVGQNMQLAAITMDGRLWHTIRFANQKWQPSYGSVNSVEANGTNVGMFKYVGVAGVN